MKTPIVAVFAFLIFASLCLAIDPPPGGGYPNRVTALGEDALFNDTGGATYTTALGYQALYNGSASVQNTAIGDQAMYSNTTGVGNVAVCSSALYANTTAEANVG